MPDTTTRLTLPMPKADGSDPYTIAADQRALASRLDIVTAMAEQGTLAGRPAAGTPRRLYFATDVEGGTLYYDTGSAWLPVEHRPSIGTTLPASPVDGQEATVLIAAATIANNVGGEVVWRFRYDAGMTSPYKWRFVGGPPLVGQLTTGGAIGAIGTVRNLDPRFTVPLAGDYDLDAQVGIYTNGTHAFWVDMVPGTIAEGITPTYASVGVPITAGYGGTNEVHKRRRATGLAAGAVVYLNLSMKPLAGPDAVLDGQSFINPSLAVTPVRVSG